MFELGCRPVPVIVAAVGNSASTDVGAPSVAVGALYVKLAVMMQAPPLFWFPNSMFAVAAVVAHTDATGGMTVNWFAGLICANWSNVVEVPPAKTGVAALQWIATPVPSGGQFVPENATEPGLNAAPLFGVTAVSAGDCHVMKAAAESAHAPHGNTMRICAVVTT